MRGVPRPAGSRAFTLVELLVSLGIIAVLLALFLPIVRGARNRGRAVSAMSAVRDIAIRTSVYGADNKLVFPQVFRPIEIEGGARQEVLLGDSVAKGFWLDNSALFFLLLAPPPTVEQLFPGAPQTVLDHERVQVRGESTGRWTTIKLADCLYYSPDYWLRSTQSAGTRQWMTQRWDSLAFPSQKGVVFQSGYYTPESGPRSVSTFASGVSTPVAWGDLSVSEQELTRLKPGVFNVYHYGLVTAPRADMPGRAVDETERGVLGTDR